MNIHMHAHTYVCVYTCMHMYTHILLLDLLFLFTLRNLLDSKGPKVGWDG